MILRQVLLASLALGSWIGAQAGDGKDASNYPAAAKYHIDTIAPFQSGLGAIMRENGYRLANAYWAANGGNWGLAQYQLQALHGAMTTAIQTNPQQAQMLSTFEQSYRGSLSGAIEGRDIVQFNLNFASVMTGCNTCHERAGFGFIRYQVPEASGSGAFLDYTMQTEPKADKPKP